MRMIVIAFNVLDQRFQMDNPLRSRWQLEPLVYKKLKAADAGRPVVWQSDGDTAQVGTLVSWNKGNVKVRFHPVETDAIAVCNAEQVSFGIPSDER